MRKHLGGLVCILMIISVTTISWKPAKLKNANINFTARELLQKYIDNLYESAHLQETNLDPDVFKNAIIGFLNLKVANKLPLNCSILSVIDYARSSHEKRLWIIDVISKALVLHTWVAHGHGSGEDMAMHFSDRIDSHQSSLGFYITDDVYFGKNGRSVRLDGVDAGFNTNARERAIVVHGADYVGEGAISENNGRLGRSFGCPAVAPEVADQVIDAIKDKTAMFISGNSEHYNSKYLDEDLAANYLMLDINSNITASL